MSWRPIDRLISCEPGRVAVAEKRWLPDEPLFTDHFPGHPLVPGVLLVEMIAATGGKAIRTARPDRLSPLAAVKSAKFHRPVLPGELCRIRSKITQLGQRHAAAEGTVEVEGDVACLAVVLYALIDRPPGLGPDPVLEAWQRDRAAGGGE